MASLSFISIATWMTLFVILNSCDGRRRVLDPRFVPTNQWEPPISLGGFPFFANKSLQEDLVYTAIQIGWRAFDGAQQYRTDRFTARAIRRAIKDGLITRDDVWITSKLNWAYLRPESVVFHGQELKRIWGLADDDSFDLLYMHKPWQGTDDPENHDQPLAANPDFIDIYEQMLELIRLGITKRIGIANINPKQLQRLLNSGLPKPFSIQIESHPYFRQEIVHSLATQNGIMVEVYAPIGSPPIADGQGLDLVLEDPTVRKISKERRITPGQVLLAYQLRRNMTRPIVRVEQVKHLKEDLHAASPKVYAKLTPGDIQRLNQLDRNQKVLIWNPEIHASPFYAYKDQLHNRPCMPTFFGMLHCHPEGMPIRGGRRG